MKKKKENQFIDFYEQNRSPSQVAISLQKLDSLNTNKNKNKNKNIWIRHFWSLHVKVFKTCRSLLNTKGARDKLELE